MSTVRCPECARTFSPDPLKDVFGPGDFAEVMSLRPFFSKCPHCGKTVQAPYPCVYADPEKGFAVRLASNGAVLAYRGDEDTTMLRHTDNILIFREKILLLSAGYDDRICEMVKLLSKSANEEAPIQDIVAVDADEQAVTYNAFMEDGSDTLFRSPRELYEKVRLELPDDVLSCRGFAVIDSAWASARATPVHQEK